MLDEQRKRLPAFFTSQLATNPALAMTAKLHSLIRVIELERASVLGAVKPEHLRLKALAENLPFRLKSPIWYLAYWVPSQPFDAVVVPTKDSFLWLDNHADDTDFAQFLANEEIPLDNPLALATFLLETKFRYLALGFKAKVVGEKRDIPLWPARLDEDPTLRTYLEEKKERLDEMGKMIAPPSLEKRSETTQLAFFIWTDVFGTIYKLKCSFGPNGSFMWHGESLANDIGDSFMPR